MYYVTATNQLQKTTEMLRKQYVLAAWEQFESWKDDTWLYNEATMIKFDV